MVPTFDLVRGARIWRPKSSEKDRSTLPRKGGHVTHQWALITTSLRVVDGIQKFTNKRLELSNEAVHHGDCSQEKCSMRGTQSSIPS